MLQLRAVTFTLAALAGSVTALGPHASLPIVNKQIAPDGFTRVWVLPLLPSDIMSDRVVSFTVLPSQGMSSLVQ